MRAPDFWQRTSLASRVLAPAGCAMALAGRLRRQAAVPVRLDVPVICVGNVVAGGAGKTPVALALARALSEVRVAAHFLLRGYGGRLTGPVLVNPDIHGAEDVGDEALLLAATGPTWVARDRAAGGLAAVRAGAGAVVMDDGFQNPSLAQSLPLLVVDGAYGFGNGYVMPAGPLREPLGDALARAAAVVLMGDDEAGIADDLARRADIPVICASLTATDNSLAGKRVVAFAGIGRPEKFFASLSTLPCTVAAARAFPDHHRYRSAELAALRHLAEQQDAILVTTAKDAVRLGPEAMAGIRILPVQVTWQDENAIRGLLATAGLGV